MNGVVQYLKVEYLICFQKIWALVGFLEFHHFVIKLISAYKELSLLKFGSGDFIFSPCWNHRINIQRTRLFMYSFTLLHYHKFVIMVVFVISIVRFL
jgi:hypothetical protein